MNELLTKKLEEQRQKQFHKETIDSAPVEVLELLKNVDGVLGEARNELIQNWQFPSRSIGKSSIYTNQKGEFWCTEFDILDEAKNLFLKNSRKAKGTIHLWLGRESPIYVIPSENIKLSLPPLFDYLKVKRSIFCLLSEIDGEWGLAIDNYCGYLEGSTNPNPHETVYEVFGW